jgi:hypothetical protein
MGHNIAFTTTSHRSWALAISVALLAGCASEKARPSTAPDARRATGLTHVVVPETDGSPPKVTIALATRRGARTLAKVSQPLGEHHTSAGELAEPHLRGTTVGEDPNGGVARVRVSISERIACRGADGSHFTRLRQRYFPPPQIEQIRAAPGARLPTRRKRSLQLSLIGARCGPDAHAVEVHGQLWGEAINGRGLEAVTPHIHFSYRRSDT